MLNSVIRMLDKTAAKFPDKIAVWDEWGEITFSELRRISLGIGTALKPSDKRLRPVMVMLPKSIRALTCFFGALYSGSPYVPVDESVPPQRLQYMASTMKGARLISSRELLARIDGVELGDIELIAYEDICGTQPDEKACMDRLNYVIDTDPAYIIHTSGSTGKPKGVIVSHRGVVDYIEWVHDTFGHDENSVLGSQSPFYFDNSVLDIYTMLYTGAKLVLIPNVICRMPAKLPEFINEHGIDSIFSVPTVLIGTANAGSLDCVPMPGLKRVLFAGEVMPNKQLNMWRRACPDAVFANLYGPTEITVDCIYYVVDREFDDAEPLPIGKACRNMRVLILRPDATETDAGEPGEICVSGSGVACGYWGKPELTRSVFTQNPLVSEYDDRMYHTGDLGYVGADGNIYFVGRMDSQIKLHGNRVELGEIETVVKGVDGIENACVLFDAEKEEIVLFAQTKENLVLRKLNLLLGGTLPKYMLPKRLYTMPELPLNANGKIDRVLLKKELEK